MLLKKITIVYIREEDFRCLAFTWTSVGGVYDVWGCFYKIGSFDCEDIKRQVPFFHCDWVFEGREGEGGGTQITQVCFLLFSQDPFQTPSAFYLLFG